MSDEMPPPKPKPSPPRLVNWLGKPIDKPTPEWKITLMAWGFAILIVSLIVMFGLIVHLETVRSCS